MTRVWQFTWLIGLAILVALVWVTFVLLTSHGNPGSLLTVPPALAAFFAGRRGRQRMGGF